MQSQNRILDDLARAANGALGALGGLKAEIDQQVASMVERVLRSQDLVTREEFEAVKEMAARAREENELLRARLDRLEGGAGRGHGRRDPDARARQQLRDVLPQGRGVELVGLEDEDAGRGGFHAPDRARPDAGRNLAGVTFPLLVRYRRAASGGGGSRSWG